MDYSSTSCVNTRVSTSGLAHVSTQAKQEILTWGTFKAFLLYIAALRDAFSAETHTAVAIKK